MYTDEIENVAQRKYLRHARQPTATNEQTCSMAYKYRVQPLILLFYFLLAYFVSLNFIRGELIPQKIGVYVGISM